MTKETNLLWERYKHEVDLHRSYLDLAIKLNIFNYAVTGAIVSFYFLHIEGEPLVRYSLILPFLMSGGLAIFFFRSALAARYSQENIHKLADDLKFDVGSMVAAVLEFLLWVFFSTLVIVAIGLFVLFFKDVNFCEYICEYISR